VLARGGRRGGCRDGRVERGELVADQRRVDRERRGKLAVHPLDLRHQGCWICSARERRDDRLQAVRDSRDRRANEEHSAALGRVTGDDLLDAAPPSRRHDAGSTELDYNPAAGIPERHISMR
jgi:hypothetical protein